MTKVCVVGLCELGLPNAIYCAARGLKIFGVDISQEAREIARDEYGIPTYGSVSEVPQVDVFLICVGTHFNEDLGGIDVTSIYAIAAQIAGLPYDPDLVVIESTIPPGTTTRVHERHLKKTRVAHLPHRFWKYDPDGRGVRRLRTLAAVDDESYQRAIAFYQMDLNMPINVMCDIQAVEFGKLAENAYRYARIAFAEELWLLCDRLGLDFNAVRDAVNTLDGNPPIMEARDGIGDDCLPMAMKYVASVNAVAIGVSDASIWTDAAYRQKRGK
jgi:UDP-N-acetyl-D-mannosaminuronic acid dehydrogenase